MVDDSRRISAHILVVCTANQCRSPLATAALRARAAERGLRVVVASAGVQAAPGIPATPPAIHAARRLGWDLTGHLSTPLTPALMNDAQLILGLERRHVQEMALLDPRAFWRTFTVKELVRRGEAAGARRAGEPIPGWLLRVNDGRRPIDLLGISTEDDVADPTGSSATDHHSTAEELDALSADVLELLYPPPA